MRRVELLAPAGNLDKLKIAITFGANAVFCGGKQLSLRAKANNFDNDDLKEAVVFAHKNKAKVHVTVNVVPNDDDLDNLDEYLIYLDTIGVDAIIVSSIYIMKRVQDLGLSLEVHVSTQHSIANSKAAMFFKENVGASRVVLARESSINNSKKIINNTNIDIEGFIHGGMCSSFSGRCTLSNSMSNRDANKGGCAHSCRWAYTLYDGNNKLSDKNVILASKDLDSIKYIKQMIKIGINSFKIEGRMKSEYYIATVVNAYRKLIDDIYDNKKITYKKYQNEILKAENRITGSGFLAKIVNENLLSSVGKEIPSQSFIGYVTKIINGISYVEVRNYFNTGDNIELFEPNNKYKEKMPIMKDLDNNKVKVANHPMQILKIRFRHKIHAGTFIRKI